MAIAEISPLTDTSLDLLELRHRRRDSALHQLVQSAFEHEAVRHPALLEMSLLRRERMGSTALGHAHAVTGAWSWCVRAPRVLVGLSGKGLEWDDAVGVDVEIVALVLTPGEAGEELHFRRMEAVTGALRLQRQRQRLLDRRDLPTLSLLLRDVPR
jgi:mannitol/fructose-specific phosphotransferase system IIA component (Ntr-type)